MGRPRKTLEDLPEDWEEQIFDLYQIGYSDAQIRLKLGICQGTWNVLQERYPEFLITIKEGQDLANGWWQQKAYDNLTSKEFNSTLWLMNMVNRFKWRRDAKDESNESTLAALLISEVLKGRDLAKSATNG